MTEQEKKLGKNHGCICSPLPPGLFIDGKNLYQIAAENQCVRIEMRNNVSQTKEGYPICMITFPDGGDREVQEEVYRLAGGMDKFYANFKPAGKIIGPPDLRQPGCQ